MLLRRYAADGTPLGDAEVVNSHTAGSQRHPSVASFADGRFLVAWESRGQDGSDWGIFAQRYDATAAKVGPEFRVNTYTQGVQRFSRVVTQGDSRYSIFWISEGQDGDGFGLFGQHFDWETGAVGVEFRVNTFTKGHQGWLGHSESSDSAGNLVVAWSGGGDQDGDAYGIFARRYCLADPAATRCGITTGSAADAQTPTATDAGVALRAAVGLVSCLVCECDSDGSGAITAADALRILRNAVGVPGELSCPACCA